MEVLLYSSLAYEDVLHAACRSLKNPFRYWISPLPCHHVYCFCLTFQICKKSIQVYILLANWMKNKTKQIYILLLKDVHNWLEYENLITTFSTRLHKLEYKVTLIIPFVQTTPAKLNTFIIFFYFFFHTFSSYSYVKDYFKKETVKWWKTVYKPSTPIHSSWWIIHCWVAELYLGLVFNLKQDKVIYF